MPRKQHKPFSLLKRGDIYYCRIWDDIEKKYLTARSTGESNKTQAAIVAARMIDEGVISTKGARLAIDYIIERLKNSGNSVRYIEDGIKFINKYCRMSAEFSKLRLPEVRGKHVIRFMDFLQEQGLSPRMINRTRDYIVPALRQAWKRGLIAHDPAATGIGHVKENLKKRGALTAEEIKKIIAMPPTNDPREKPYMVIACLTGARRGELRALKWQDIDSKNAIIHIHQSFTETGGLTKPKTEGSVRDVPILKPVADALSELQDISPYDEPDDFVFFQKNRGVPVPGHFPEHAFSRVLDAIGVDKAERQRRHLTPHSTRHSFVTFTRSLLPDMVVGGMSGHTTNELLDNYGRIGTEHFKTAREILDAALSQNKPDDEKVH